MKDDFNSTTTRLLTLLNTSAGKVQKRKLDQDYKFVPAQKLNKRKTSAVAEIQSVPAEQAKIVPDPQEKMIVDDPVEEEPADTIDAYEMHYGMQPEILAESSRAAVDRNAWQTSRHAHGKLGQTIHSVPEGSTPPSLTSKTTTILDRLRQPFTAQQSKQPVASTEYQNDLLSAVSSYQDVYLSATPLDSQKRCREALSLHALNHVTKKRRRVLKNNERIAHAAKTNPDDEAPEDVQDQGFTRPSVLILLPFRSSALNWLNALTSHTPSPAFQIENRARFINEFGLPPDAVDKLASAEPGTYPEDHVETFKGNVDDNFRVGIKLTRKSVKLFSDFYGCDIIFASPLGLRMSIEKEKNADFLSSIEMVIADQMDALAMQNWEHVQYVFSNLNKLPKESHNTDFSRIKPWYLDGHSAYLRQTVLLSAYDTPEMRSLYNTSLKNVAGKVRTVVRYAPVDIPEGVHQDFVLFDATSPKDEADKRFNHFTTQLLPSILKSAVQSTNAVVFVPSSFDFIRVHNYFRKEAGVEFAVLSEYSTNQDISRARQAFFSGNKAFLLISERFHFYRRYKIRGIRNLIFYGPPDHAQFYTELLSYPFLDEGVEPSDVTCRVLYSKYDWFRMERIAGTQGAKELISTS